MSSSTTGADRGKGGYIIGDNAGTNVGFSSRGDGSVDVVIRADNDVDIRFDMTPDAVVGLRDYLEMAAKQRPPTS